MWNIHKQQHHKHICLKIHLSSSSPITSLSLTLSLTLSLKWRDQMNHVLNPSQASYRKNVPVQTHEDLIFHPYDILSPEEPPGWV
tara:strand:- start:512 stop:766 length:255 start_codon:yes stop_codon:yes gene_type:complete